MDLNHLKNLNVLYVEDDKNIADPTCSLLEKLFHNVYYSDNAENGLEVIKNEIVHLIVTDIELPGMDGISFCKKIREEDQDVPIFITTIHDDYNILKEAIKLNLVDFLVKPISVSTIFNVLAESLNRINNNNSTVLNFGNNIDFYPSSGDLIISNKKVNLTKNELKIMSFMAKNKTNLITKTMCEDVLDTEEPMSDASYKNIIYRLRKKIGKDSLHTIPGVGIKLKM